MDCWKREAVAGLLGRQAIPMVWDFAELNPFGEAGSNSVSILKAMVEAVNSCNDVDAYANVIRTSATELPYPEKFFDAIITDPPYYDNVPCADLSDFFYVWLKRLYWASLSRTFFRRAYPEEERDSCRCEKVWSKERQSNFTRK